MRGQQTFVMIDRTDRRPRTGHEDRATGPRGASSGRRVLIWEVLAEVSNSRRAAFAVLLGLTLIAAGCSSDQDEGAPVSAALKSSVVELRQSLGQQWGEPIPGLAAAASVGEGSAVSAVASGSATTRSSTSW